MISFWKFVFARYRRRLTRDACVVRATHERRAHTHDARVRERTRRARCARHAHFARHANSARGD